jgi:hypothetical protein
MAELVIKINCGEDKCMNCASLMLKKGGADCLIFRASPIESSTSFYRLEACKKAEIKELR